jgi:hypothetical protein
VTAWGWSRAYPIQQEMVMARKPEVEMRDSAEPLQNRIASGDVHQQSDEDCVRVRPAKIFEWHGALTRLGLEGSEIEVSRLDAAELRANGLILVDGDQEAAMLTDPKATQVPPRIAVVERRDGRVDPPDDKEAGRRLKLGL